MRGLDYYNRTAFEFFTDMVVENEKDPSLPGLKFDFASAAAGVTIIYLKCSETGNWRESGARSDWIGWLKL